MADGAIKDPATGQGATVDREGHLHTFSVTSTLEHHANQFEEEAYNVLFAVNPAAGGDCFFYMKNLDDVDVVIEGINYSSSAAEEIYIEIANMGTPGGTSDSTTPANLNAGSGKAANVTCETAIADGAVDITGLSGGREIERIWITAAADTKYFNFEQDVIVPKNQAFSLWCVGGDTNIRGSVIFHFHNED